MHTKITSMAIHQMVLDMNMLKATAITKSVTIFITCCSVTAFFLSATGTAHASDGCKLTVLGDSLTAGYGVEADEAFPAQLSKRLEMENIECGVINAGVSGDTSAGGASRIGWILADTPTHVLVELGGNDALRALPTQQMRDNLTTIIETAQSAGSKVMLAGMLAPPNLGPEYGASFQRIFTELAAAYELPLYPFFLEGVAGRPSLLIEDGIHPNAEGVAMIVDGILPMLREFLTSGEE